MWQAKLVTNVQNPRLQISTVKSTKCVILTMEKPKAFQMLKTCRLSRVYTRKRRIGLWQARTLQSENPHARLPRTRTKSPLTIFSLSPISLSLEGFLGTYATDDFDLLILRPVYILIMYGELLVPSPVTLVVDLREIEGRSPPVPSTLAKSK